jgi:hypothetical protein
MFFAFGPEIGYKVFTASGILNDSGKPQAVYAVAALSGGTATQACLYDGTSSLGTGALPIQGTINLWTYISPAIGVMFPSGCFVSFDGTNATKIIVYARQAMS